MKTMYGLFGETMQAERPPTPLKYLLRLQSTAEIEQNLEHARQPLPEHSPVSGLAVMRDMQAERQREENIHRWEQELADAQRRDAIVATRPEGCWCLGLGGSDERTADSGDQYLAKICNCPEGLVAGEHKRMIRNAEAKRREQYRIEALWGNAQIPARFQDMRLSTSPLVKSSPLILERLRRPHSPWDDYPDGSEPPETESGIYFKLDDIWWGSWFLYGAYGTGKTGTAVGMAWERVVANEEFKGGEDVLDSLLFISGPRLFSELRSTYNRGEGPTEQEVIDKYAKVKLLVFDDIGAEQIKSQDWLADRLYQIVGERHDQLLPTIFTSNLSLEQLAKRVGERVTWRIVEMVGKNIVHLDGPNLRA